ncbi:MAG: hypothetical protein KJ061_18085 [Vicinamibacteraceae bacterium]|nr:hypothetical protein [Vicinamibacteraceae bacterium]
MLTARGLGFRPAATLAALLMVAPAAAQVPEEPAPAGRSPSITWRLNVEWITAARGTAPRETVINPGNRVLRVPQWQAQSELRPNLRVEMGSRWQLVVRPRLLATWDRTWADARRRAEATGASANWTELFVAWRPHDAVAVTYGLQNFQWGPAELVSPSNRVFHEVGLFRDALYYVRGKHLLRVNLSAGRQWSLVTLAELGANGEPPFEAGNRFRRKAQTKLEWSTESGASYVGLTAGAAEAAPPSLGAYGSVAVTEGLALYTDVSATRGSRAWFPVAAPVTPAVPATPAMPGVPGTAPLFVFQQKDRASGVLRWHVLGGARYTFVNGVDARLEYVHQDAGYSTRDFRHAALALSAAPNPAAAEPYTTPGLEFLGRRLALVSVRLPDLPPAGRLEIQGRYLASLTDGSGVAFVTASGGATDRVTLFASAALTHGAWDAELSRLARASVVGGLVWNW